MEVVLVHGAVLKGQRYEASLSVWADGLRMCLDEPYSNSCIYTENQKRLASLIIEIEKSHTP